MEGLAFYAVALVVLLALSAFFSGSEAALFSLGRTRVRALAEASPAGREVARLMEQPRRLLVTILLGNLFVNIFATSAATAFLLRLFGEAGLGYAFVVMSVLIMAFGEIVPKTIALHSAERFASLAIFPLRFLHTLFWPARMPLAWVSDRVIDYARRHIGASKRSFTREELMTALRIGRREGGVGVFESEVLTNVLEFRHKRVREIMTPSIHVLSAPIDTRREEFSRMFADSGHSRVPTYEDSTDNIVGIVHVKDLADPDALTTVADVRARLRKPFYIQESAPINDLYNQLQGNNQHMAVVLDEYGSFAGLVTIEDILEELVGEIRDARDNKAQSYQRIDDKRVVVLGTMELDDFNDLFETRLRDDDHDTIAGYVVGLTGRIPQEGETIDDGDLRFHVISAQPNRIRKMRVEKR